MAWQKKIATCTSNKNGSLRSVDDQVLPNDHNNDIRMKVFTALRQKAIEITKAEPFMKTLLTQTILHPESSSFNKAIARIAAARLMSSCGTNNSTIMSTIEISTIIEEAMNSKDLEYGHTMADAVCQDILACVKRDPACETELEVVLFYKGFAALVCHRAARRHYKLDGSRRFVSLWLQSQASAAFGVDIHPAAEIGSGVFFDHATGLVIGETAKVGDNCTILHGVTLGGTGKDGGDRHPKVGNDVLIGAGTKVLGNIKIGDGAKIGAGSIVLKPIPSGATAVGTPARIIGRAKKNKPGSSVDNALSHVIKAEDCVDRISCEEKSLSSPPRTESLSSLSSEQQSTDDDVSIETRFNNAQRETNALPVTKNSRSRRRTFLVPRNSSFRSRQILGEETKQEDEYIQTANFDSISFYGGNMSHAKMHRMFSLLAACATATS